MTKNIAGLNTDLETGLLACCRHLLAQLAGQVDIAAELAPLQEISGPQGRKETLEQLMRVSRAAGLAD